MEELKDFQKRLQHSLNNQVGFVVGFFISFNWVFNPADASLLVAESATWNEAFKHGENFKFVVDSISMAVNAKDGPITTSLWRASTFVAFLLFTILVPILYISSFLLLPFTFSFYLFWLFFCLIIGQPISIIVFSLWAIYNTRAFMKWVRHFAKLVTNSSIICIIIVKRTGETILDGCMVFDERLKLEAPEFTSLNPVFEVIRKMGRLTSNIGDRMLKIHEFIEDNNLTPMIYIYCAVRTWFFALKLTFKVIHWSVRLMYMFVNLLIVLTWFAASKPDLFVRSTLAIASFNVYCLSWVGALGVTLASGLLQSLGKAKETLVTVRVFALSTYLKVMMFLHRHGFLINDRIQNKRAIAVRESLKFSTLKKMRKAQVPSWLRPVIQVPSSIIEDIDLMARELQEAGYPTSGFKTTKPLIFSTVEKFKEWVVTGSTPNPHIRKMQIFKGEEYKLIRKSVTPYRWTDEYVNIQNELESISRYFKDKIVSVETSKEVVNDTWDLVSPIFKHSRFATLEEIFSKWNKKFNLGPMAYEKVETKFGSRYRKMRRRTYLSKFNSKAELLKSWENITMVFPKVKAISNAFFKSEAIKPKKWKEGKVRTPISSFLPQYLWQMLFSFQPNHNFQPLKTPIKVGLPLNGYWLGKTMSEHFSRDYHYAGDMSDFDSTISKDIQKLIKEIRLKGFEGVPDLHLIEIMLEKNYDALNSCLITTPSTGNIYRKGSGLTTGHASTSMDNSLTTVALYMFAWRKLTGLSSKEFKYFNTLSCYGDDHLLSFRGDCPPSWTFGNIQTVLSDAGVEMRDEVPEKYTFNKQTGEKIILGPRNPRDITCLPFLSKYFRKRNTSDVLEWERHTGLPGSTCPPIIVWHDRQSLIGKAAAGSTNKSLHFRVERLKAYQSLCAHNYDQFCLIEDMINHIRKAYPELPDKIFQRADYGKVLRTHYSKGKKSFEEKIGDDSCDSVENPGESLYVVREKHFFEQVFEIIQRIPTTWMGKIHHWTPLQLFKGLTDRYFSWPAELVLRSNRVHSDASLFTYMSKTPYAWVPKVPVNGRSESNVSLLLKHWIYLLLCGHSSRSTIAELFASIQSKMSSLNFIVNGTVLEDSVQHDVPYYKAFVCMLLNCIPSDLMGHLDPITDSVFSMKLPTFQRVISSLFQEMKHSLHLSLNVIEGDELSAFEVGPEEGAVSLLQAGTGTGKSTSFVSHLASKVGGFYDKIIVVEPRSKVVSGLTSYMQSKGLDCSGATTGIVLDKRAKVWYVTAQELLLHLDWVKAPNLLVLDECHLVEPAYVMLKKMIRAGVMPRTILVSATPGSESLMASITVRLADKTKFNVAENFIGTPEKPIPASEHKLSTDYWFEDYSERVKRNLFSLTPGFKALVYVPDKAQAVKLADSLPFRSIPLTSETEGVDFKDYQVIVSTSVADVAITIEGVTHVFSSNVTRIVVSDATYKREPKLLTLDPQTLKQRKGRTGRTNDGSFTLYTYGFKGLLTSQPGEPSIVKVAQWVADGLPYSLLEQFDAGVLEQASLEEGTDTGTLLKSLEKFNNDNYTRSFYRIDRERKAGLGPDYTEVQIGHSRIHHGKVSDNFDFVNLLDSARELIHKYVKDLTLQAEKEKDTGTSTESADLPALSKVEQEQLVKRKRKLEYLKRKAVREGKDPSKLTLNDV